METQHSGWQHLVIPQPVVKKEFDRVKRLPHTIDYVGGIGEGQRLMIEKLIVVGERTCVMPSAHDLTRVKIIGQPVDRWVETNGEPLHPEYSQRIRNHSPDGFMWGYHGSGPAQLALAILMRFTPLEFALNHYQEFKDDFVANWHDGFTVEINLHEWVRAKLNQETEKNDEPETAYCHNCENMRPVKWVPHNPDDPDTLQMCACSVCGEGISLSPE